MSQNGSSIGGSGGSGRVRIEAYTNTGTITLAPVPAGRGAPTISQASPTTVTLTEAPTLRITTIGGVTAPVVPAGALSNPDVVLPSGTTNPVTVNLAASNIPLGTTISVTVRGISGGNSAATSTGLAGTLASSTASAAVTIPLTQPSVVSAAATFTFVAANGGGPVFAGGEEVERVRVTAALGGPSQLVYITKSGREIPMAHAR